MLGCSGGWQDQSSPEEPLAEWTGNDGWIWWFTCP